MRRSSGSRPNAWAFRRVELEAADGVVRVAAVPSRAVSYASLVGGRKFTIALDPNAKRKQPRAWTVLGQPVPRLDLPAMATGQFEFVHNVRLPGMLHGQVVRPPAVGATLLAVDEGSVRDVPGLVKVVAKKNFVGVVAEKPWQALQAARKLKVSWTKGVGLPAQRDVHEYLRRQRPTRDTLLVDSKDVDEKLAQAVTVVKATYLHPYQMHGSLGSSCAVADVQGDKATIWSPTQAVHPHRTTAAMILGLRPENVRVIFRMGSGCYGLNGAEAVSYDAALLSQAVGKPVRVQLTRKDEMAWENYGLAYRCRPTGRSRRAGPDHRLGLRDVVAGARRPAGWQQPGQRRDRLPGRLRASRVQRRARRRRIPKPSTTAATPCPPTSSAAWARSAAAPAA